MATLYVAAFGPLFLMRLVCFWPIPVLQQTLIKEFAKRRELLHSCPSLVACVGLELATLDIQ